MNTDIKTYEIITINVKNVATRFVFAGKSIEQAAEDFASLAPSLTIINIEQIGGAR